MNANAMTGGGCDTALENLAAELTSVAYPVALRQAVGTNWLDLELDLWHALTETVLRRAREHHRAGE